MNGQLVAHGSPLGARTPLPPRSTSWRAETAGATRWRDRLEIHAISPAEMIHVGQPFRGLEPVCSRVRRCHRARLLIYERAKPSYGLSNAQTAEKRLKRSLESHFGSMPRSALHATAPSIEWCIGGVCNITRLFLIRCASFKA